MLKFFNQKGYGIAGATGDTFPRRDPNKVEGAAAPSQGVPLPAFEAVEVVTGKPVSPVVSAAPWSGHPTFCSPGEFVHASLVYAVSDPTNNAADTYGPSESASKSTWLVQQ